MRKIIPTFITLFFVSFIYAQDIELEAKNNYLKAEEAYNNDNYYSAYLLSCKATNTLGKENSKILYLKIRSFYSHMKQIPDLSNYAIIDGLLKTFFKITNSKIYSEEKYTDIINIRNEIGSKIEEVYNLINSMPKAKEAFEKRENRITNNKSLDPNSIKTFEYDQHTACVIDNGKNMVFPILITIYLGMLIDGLILV